MRVGGPFGQRTSGKSTSVRIQYHAAIRTAPVPSLERLPLATRLALFGTLFMDCGKQRVLASGARVLGRLGSVLPHPVRHLPVPAPRVSGSVGQRVRHRLDVRHELLQPQGGPERR